MGQKVSREKKWEKEVSQEKKWEKEVCNTEPKPDTIDLLSIENLLKTEPIHELFLRLSTLDRMAVIRELQNSYWDGDKLSKVSPFESREICDQIALELFKEEPRVIESAMSILIDKEKMIQKISDEESVDLNPEDQFGPDDIKRLMENATSKLRVLTLWRNDSIKWQGAQEIAKFLERPDCALETLQLEECWIPEKGIIALAEALKKNDSLHTLNLQLNHIKDEAALALAEALKQNRSLKTLNLSYSHFGDQGTLALAQAMKENTTLTDLELKQARGCNPVLLADGLKGRSHIKNLNLEFVHIDVNGIKALAKALHDNHHLEYLNLAHTFQGNHDQVMTSFAHNISTKNTTLKSLDISCNHIGPKGAKAIALLLAKMPLLQDLNVEHNKLGDEGAEYLAESLALKSTSIERLQMNENNIKERGICALANALAKNTSLEFLNLSSNRVGDQGAFCLARAIVANKTLHHLKLSATKIGERGSQAIANSLTKNTTLDQFIVRPRKAKRRYSFFPTQTFQL